MRVYLVKDDYSESWHNVAHVFFSKKDAHRAFMEYAMEVMEDPADFSVIEITCSGGLTREFVDMRDNEDTVNECIEYFTVNKDNIAVLAWENESLTGRVSIKCVDIEGEPVGANE